MHIFQSTSNRISAEELWTNFRDASEKSCQMPELAFATYSIQCFDSSLHVLKVIFKPNKLFLINI